MKSFFSSLIASFLGVFLASIALFFVLIGAIVGLVSQIESNTGVQTLDERSVMRLRLDYPIAEKTSDDPFAHYDFNTMEVRLVLGLDDIIDSIQRGAKDPNIEGIYLNLSPVAHGWANTESLRNALLAFKASGKWIIAYSEYYSHASYYLSSVADEVYLNPEGLMQFQGLSAQSLFLKDSFAKLDIDMQVLRGPDNEYKSAVETFVNSEMSERSRFQTQALVDEIWQNTLSNIAEQRQLSKAVLNQIADRLALNSADAALQYQLVDGLRYYDEVRVLLNEKMQLSADDSIPVVDIEEYAALHRNKSLFADLSAVANGKDNQIAVVYAEGDIMPGENGQGIIGSTTTAAALRSARKNNKVKAMVLRINSPGGSALASDVILREVYLSRLEKPVVVSFGNVAASGGYYIASAGDKIFAEPGTITGSIGVFSILPNLKGFFNNKLGVTFDSVNTNQYADFGNTTQALKPYEKQQIEKQMQQVYQTFKDHVAKGRGLTESEVENIAKGRVWSGVAARDIGLVDEIGSLGDAISEAAAMANLTDYELLKLPRAASPFESFISQGSSHARAWLFDGFLSEALLSDKLSLVLDHYQTLESVGEQDAVQVRMPFHLMIE